MANWLTGRLHIFGLLLLAGLKVGAVEAEPQLDHAKVEAFVDGAVRQASRADQIAGVTVAIVDRAGTIMTKGYGFRGFAPLKTVHADTLFRVGSISKTVVWIAIMQLVEQGKISLDDPINERLPESLRVPDEGFRNPILIRHLMTHSAGFEDSLEGLFIHDPARLRPTADFLATHRVHRVREPGVLAVYSNYGAALAGALVANVTGEPWQDYAEAHILRPLGMMSATYREPYPDAVAKAQGLGAPMAESVAAEVTSGFSRESGAYQTQPFEYISDFVPAGALSASANDMAAYMRALLDPAWMEKSGVLRAETALALREPLFANAPDLNPLLHGFFDLNSTRGRHGFGHGGALVFQQSTLEVYPDEGVAIFMSVNTPTGDALLNTFPSVFLDAFFGPAPASPPMVENPEAEAAKVAGTYLGLRRPSFRSDSPLLRYNAEFEVKALRSGHILLYGTKRYTPIGGGVFVSTVGRERIAFHEAGERMRLFDSSGAFPSDRIDYFQQWRWLRLIAGLAAFAAGLAVVAAIRRAVMVRGQPPAAELILAGLAVLWLTAGGLIGVAVWPWLKDPNSELFTYPGALYPIACWALLAAAIATPVAAVIALGLMRRAGWSPCLWLRQGATLIVYAALILTLFDWGLLGFRDFASGKPFPF
jgi:CubicO group peptidase (beta-lactamase class C family)